LELWKCPFVVLWGKNAGAQRSVGGLTRRHWETRCNGWAVLKYVTTSVLLSGCAVGPEFRAPPPPEVTSLSPTPVSLAGRGGVEQQAYVQGLDIPRRWWELFHCDPLNTVVARAIDRNPDLAAAQAALRIANANTQAARGGYYPQVGASIGSSSQKPNVAQTQPIGTGTSPYTIATGQLSVSFVLDVFGLNKRRVESLAAQAEAQHFEVEAAYLTLTSKLALAVIEEASIREETKSAEASIAVANDVLAVLRKQAAVNEATRVDISAQEVTLSQFQQALQSLRKRLATNRDLIVALTGGLAGDGLKEKFEFACLHLPPDLPLSLPASIVRKRPDVRAAEANMHAATAEIGVAIANRFPQFNLTANAGASAIAKLAGASPPFLFWTLAGSAAQTLFDGMSTEQKQRAAEAGLERSAALYRSTVIAAFQNVADVLQTIEADRQLFVAADRGAKAAQVNLDLTRQLLTQRLVSVLQVLSAQEMYARAKSSHAQAKAAQRADTVLLFQALGGGWDSRRSSDPDRQTRGWTPMLTKVNE
jgi:NodT family efflux transporter outer membrane factor (OMF) lipoprotein